MNEHTAPDQTSKTCAIFQYSDTILSELLSFLNTLSEEPDKSLEEAAEEYKQGEIDTNVDYHDDTGEPLCFMEALKSAFIVGAEWQKEKDTRDMYMSDNRHFQKVYELGKKDMKEQMMKELEVDLDKEIDNYFYPKNFKRVNDGVEFPGWHVSDWKNPNVGKTLYTEDIRRFAHHFYELKLNTRKEK